MREVVPHMGHSDQICISFSDNDSAQIGSDAWMHELKSRRKKDARQNRKKNAVGNWPATPVGSLKDASRTSGFQPSK
jgi:hypothetical protein